MMSFISQVLQELLEKNYNISETTFILPSKRAGAYLINRLAQMQKSAMFAPRVLSIEDFSEEVAGLTSVDNITALFEFYTAYLACTPKEEAESFEVFSAWAQTLLYDFNEIDRYLVDYKSFFGYLSDIQEMNHWYLEEEKTPLMKNYLSFWEKLPVYYERLKEQLSNENLAYQGMVYRSASEKIDAFIADSRDNYVFIGFNALNNAEQLIFQKMVEAGKAEIYWDIDETFLEDEQHDVSLFLRQYLNKWPNLKKGELKKVTSEFKEKKEIDVVGIPKNVGQAKYVGQLLSQLSPEELKNTAVVLGDESLLLPVLNSMPPNVQEVNITMGFALKNAPVAFLFEHLLKLHAGPATNGWYYKEVTAICNHPLIQKVTGGYSARLSEMIKKDNRVHVSRDLIYKDVPADVLEVYKICFGNWQNSATKAVGELQKLIYLLKAGMDVDKDKLSLEFLYQLHLLLNQLENLLQKYDYITSVKILRNIFKDLLASKTVDFRGKPFSGLQLMGMLESRVLDFKNVILTSVNEGVLPAGKSSNSFVPYDLKCAYHLPTFKEKDAVYTYHFYHLLQRAERVHLLYNTESDGLNAGEKSRFLLQLELEPQEQHIINKFNVTPFVPAIKSSLKSIEKTPEIIDRIKVKAERGFSPSALTTYIRNPLDFYKQYILEVQEPEEVEETVAYNTLGSVVHDALENFYKQWLGRNITVDDLKKAITETPSEIKKQFRTHYTDAPLNSGKNLLIYEVAKRYVINFLKTEIRELEGANAIKVLQVENKLECKLNIPELNFPVNLKGTVDRVDEFNGKMRIIDYKTGKVDQSKVEIVDWNEITSDYDKYSKPFQILTYALLLNEEKPFEAPVEAGIVSFKNLQAGFLKFNKKDKNGRGAKKDPDVTRETLEAFTAELKNLILEICDPNIPFVEKEIKQNAW